MRSGFGHSAQPSMNEAGKGLRGDLSQWLASLHIVRYVAATEWVMHIADVKTPSARRLTRLGLT